MPDSNVREINSAPRTQPSVSVHRHPLPAGPGRLSIRYTTSAGQYLGEIELFAINEETTKIIIADLYSVTHKVIVSG